MSLLAKKVYRKLKEKLVEVLKGRDQLALYKGVKLGTGCRIYITDWGSEPFLISIGDNVTITSGVKFLTHDGATCLVKNSSGVRYQKYLPIQIGDNVFIGVNTIIMPGVTIGNNVIVAAGSVVSKSVEAGSVVGGVPARNISSFDIYASKIMKGYLANDEVPTDLNYKQKVKFMIEKQSEKK
ncbi:acyltransferase [Pseudoalteromonas sp. Angola-4]|uniref:acyltransferase n=1 Tax=Pseudoalteromonas sp. Angola-4 TaxID=3025335 RepID=UPI00235978A6|nr:acyltransferase [Pseudoalteromonas sp. Angola-4]MDC9511493.1 acyltransferase [Pseudoalteromonas sp. Angola-4]